MPKFPVAPTTSDPAAYAAYKRDYEEYSSWYEKVWNIELEYYVMPEIIRLGKVGEQIKACSDEWKTKCLQGTSVAHPDPDP